MLDIQFIRENKDQVQQAAANKKVEVDVDRLLELDEQRRELIPRLEDLQRQRNEHAQSLQNGQPTPEQIEQGRQLKQQSSELESQLTEVEDELNQLVRNVPNLPLADVPIGASEDDNVVVKTVGEKPHFDFEPKSHVEIAATKGWIDKERAAKVAGARFTYLKGDLARLQFAIIQFVIDTLGDETKLQEIVAANNLSVSTKPFEPILPPMMVRTDAYEATARLDAEETTYKLADDELWLNASAEHSLCNMYMDEILPANSLPLRYVGYATSFRREAGTYGKDMEGILRLHQFDKLEMEVFSDSNSGLEEHKFLVAVQEYLVQQLGLSYQVVQKCTADIGKPNAQGVDIDTWMPGQDKYRETHTADYMTDYQARRLKTRVRQDDGSVSLVHTNDATAFALGRIMIAIIENYQTVDGSVRIPEALKMYMNGREQI